MKSSQNSILIIDDSAVIRERVCAMLADCHVNTAIHEAASGSEGLDLARTLKPVMIVLDIRMPGLNGIDVLADIKKIKPSPSVAVLTNYPFPSYRSRCLELGADYFLDKSTEFPRLKEIFAALASNKTAKVSSNDPVLKEKAKILLVEDNEMNRDMLIRRLSRSGFELVSAVDGQEGLDKAREELPDLVLMDLSIPVIDGWEVTRQLKADEMTSHIPIIALTAHALKADREKAFGAGCDDYDTKPVDFNRLIEKIDSQLAGVKS